MIVAVVPVKDNLVYTRQITELLEQQDDAVLWVLDNGSSGETAQFLARRNDVIDTTGLNLHQQWNVGIELALGTWGCTSVAFLNNDVGFTDRDCLQKCDEAVKEGDFVLVSPNHDGRPGTGIQEVGWLKGDGIVGWAMVLQREWVEETGYRFPSPPEWWYGDDDLVQTVKRAGKKMGVVLDAHGGEHLDGGSKTGGNWSHVDLEADRRAFLQKWGK